jgi:hypothetical protein
MIFNKLAEEERGRMTTIRLLSPLTSGRKGRKEFWKKGRKELECSRAWVQKG